ncbi:unnamed protein product [Dibothriocephalus latus]|uniref:Uncharacterized protein n=1 Tax=Dibothriocephalus latus TaxID=60516 RepID=A0A3P7P543_DIBLA|nr:unnamed protein product [Dibothriocephalus latus]
MATSTPRTTPNQMEQGEDPSCLLRESNNENPEEVMTDQVNLGSSLKHRGVGHGLPTLPEDLPLNMSNKEVKANAGSSNFTPSWRANAHLKPSSPGGEGAHGDDHRGDCCWCCSCCPCCRNCRCHPALARVLLWIYEKTAGPLAYCLFFALIYVCLWIFTGKEALPPKCYEYKRIDAPVHEGLSAKKMEKPVAFCEGGKSLNILILYMFAVLVGQLTELIRLPGLVGQ